MTFHNPTHEGVALEIKSEAEGLEQDGGDIADVVTKALEGIRADLGARLEKLETKSVATERRLSRPAIIPSRDDSANDAALEAKAFSHYLRTGETTFETKALTVVGGTGGVLVPPSYQSNILEKLVEWSPIRGLATVTPMSGALLEIPRGVDDAEPGMVAETGARPEGNFTFDKIDLKPFEMAVVVRVARTLMEDSAVNLDAYINARLAKKFGQKEGRQFVIGNGTNEAEGVLTSPDVGVFTSTATTIKAADIIDLVHSLPSYYAGRGAFLMNRTTLAAVRKLTNTNGDFLWEPSSKVGDPATLYGAPVYEAPDMPNVAAGATPIVFGDFATGYTIGDRVNFDVRQDDMTEWDNGIVRFLARRRVGGRVVEGEALAKLKLKAA